MQRFLGLVLAIVLTSCDSPAGTQNTVVPGVSPILPVSSNSDQSHFEKLPPNISTVDLTGLTDQTYISLGEAFASYRTTCLKAGGKFNETKLNCECPSQQTFNGWSENCLQLEYQKDTQNPVKTLLIQLTERSSSTSIDIEGEDTELTLEKLFADFDPNIPSTPNSVDIILFSGQSSQLTKRAQRAVRIDNLLASQNSGLVPRTGKNIRQIVFYLPKAIRNRQDYQSNNKEWIEPLSEKAHGSQISPLRWKQITSTVQAIRGLSTDQFMVLSNNANHCLKSCVVEGTYQSGGNGKDPIYARFRRTYHGGNVVANTLTLYQSPAMNQASTMLWYTPTGKLSFIYLFQTESTPTGEVATTTQVFNSDGEVFQEPIRLERPFNIKNLSRLRDGFTPLAADTYLPNTVLCEYGFSETPINSIGQDRFLRPSSTPRTISGSMDAGEALLKGLLGWVSLPKETTPLTPLYFSGIESRNEYGAVDTEGDLEHHAFTVASNLTTPARSNFGIIPIGGNECLEKPTKWLQNVIAEPKIRVVSMSTLSELDRTACKTSGIAQAITKTKGRLLWIVAAGNDGANLNDPAIDLCPANLGDLKKMENLIVVGSGNRNHLDYFSNYSSTFVHLAADGADNLDPQSRATSYAAPRVAGAVARLTFDFPQLSLSQVKTCLLTGVDVNIYFPLNVLSGGSLNEEVSSAICREWANDPKQNAETVITEVFKARSDWNYQDKIDFFRKRGII